MNKISKLLTILFLILFIPICFAQYTAKDIKILTYSVVSAEVWAEAFDLETLIGAQARTTIRKWYLKARENDDIDTSFDYNYSSATPTYWATNAGQGFGQDNAALPAKIYIRARSADLILELVYYN